MLVCAAVSESWVLQGLSHPVRLRDCRPRHRSLVSGRPREDSCVDVGKSILLATASSESWMSARMENKQKLESSGLLFFFFFLKQEFSKSVKPQARSRAALKPQLLQPAVAPQKGGLPYVQNPAPHPPRPLHLPIPSALLTGSACDQAADAYCADSDVTQPCKRTASALTK